MISSADTTASCIVDDFGCFPESLATPYRIDITSSEKRNLHMDGRKHVGRTALVPVLDTREGEWSR
jgi:hypothetical protein